MLGDDRLERLRVYLFEEAAAGSDVIATAPFAMYTRQTDQNVTAHAILAGPLHGDIGSALSQLRSAAPRGLGEIAVTAIADDLAATDAMLAVAGLADSERTALLIATPETLRPAPAVPDLRIATLDAASDLASLRENLDTNERGFDPAAAPMTAESAASFRAGMRGNLAFTAYLDGRAVGAGMFTPPHAGVTELVGVATLAEYRRRGIATALTACAARTAFTCGCKMIFLSARTPEARRLYERLGFCPFVTLLNARLPLHADER